MLKISNEIVEIDIPVFKSADLVNKNFDIFQSSEKDLLQIKMMANQIVRRLLGSSLRTPFANTKCLSTSARLMEKARVQHPAPEFKGQAVIDGQFKEIALEDYKGKWLVFFFYPLDFTFVCPTEIIAFSDKIQEFKDINCEVSSYTVF